MPEALKLGFGEGGERGSGIYFLISKWSIFGRFSGAKFKFSGGWQTILIHKLLVFIVFFLKKIFTYNLSE